MPKDKQMINNKFFKEWSSNMAYVLGFVVADGCVMKRKDRKDSFIFNITTKDREHLENIQKAMCSKYQIGLKSGGGSRERNISFVQITNKEICLDLINLGVIPRKTYNLGEIKIPDEYFADFARGFFDGDGTVYIYNVNNTPQIKVGFVCASAQFINHFNKQLCKFLGVKEKSVHLIKAHGIKANSYSIDFYISDCEKFYNFIYGNNPELYLERKLKVFEDWQNIKRRHYIKKDYPSKIGWHLNENLIRDGFPVYFPIYAANP